MEGSLPFKKSFLIAEIALSHDGNLNFAHHMIDCIAKRTDCDAVKFQTHITDEESSPSEPWRKRFSWIDDSRYDYWKRTEFSEEEWSSLARHCKESGVRFISSPFSRKAVDILSRLDMPFWKIASGETNNYPMIDEICRRNGKIVVSTGLSNQEELEHLHERIIGRGGELECVLECTSKYPAPPEEINLARMVERGRTMGVAYGLSDHSASTTPLLAAMLYGAEIIEFHVTHHRDSFGPDSIASITIDELNELCQKRSQLEQLTKTKVDNVNFENMRSIFRKSIYIRKDLKKGALIEESDLIFRKPYASVGADAYESVVGKMLKKDIYAGEEFTWDLV